MWGIKFGLYVARRLSDNTQRCPPSSTLPLNLVSLRSRFALEMFTVQLLILKTETEVVLKVQRRVFLTMHFQNQTDASKVKPIYWLIERTYGANVVLGKDSDKREKAEDGI